MIIFNELDYAQDMVKNGFKQKRYEFELKILSKYYVSIGLIDEELKQKIKEFCHKHIKAFNEVLSTAMINRVCKFGEKHSLFVAKPIRITSLEIDKIKELKNLKYEKIAFVMLVLSKVKKQMYMLHIKDKIKFNKSKKKWKFKGYYVNEKINQIFKIAKVYLNKVDRQDTITHLMKKELISLTENCNFKVDFVNNHTQNNEVIIDNFENFVLRYSELIGDNIGTCEICSAPYEIRGKNQKYCKKCWKEIRKSQNKEKALKYYYKTKTLPILKTIKTQ